MPAGEIHVDALLVRLARPRCGVVERRALLDAGVSTRAIDRRTKGGFPRPLFRGTYAVGHPHPHAWLHTALLVAGQQAALSHRTVTALLELLPRRPGPIHVTTLNHVRSRPGLIVHRADLDPSETTTRHGLLLTSVRTQHDIAPTTSEAELRHAVDQVHAKRLIRPGQLQPIANRPGAAALRRALGDHHGLTRSEAQRDRDRDAHLLQEGYRTLRFTWRDLTERPELVVARVAAALRLAPPPRPRGAG